MDEAMGVKDFLTRCAVVVVAFILLGYLLGVPHLAGLAVFFWLPFGAYYMYPAWRQRRKHFKMPPPDQFDREWRDFLDQEGTR